MDRNKSGWLSSLVVHVGILACLGWLLLPLSPIRRPPLEIQMGVRPEATPYREVKLDAALALPTTAVPVALTREEPLAWPASPLTLADLSAAGPPSKKTSGSSEEAFDARPPGVLPPGGTSFFGIPAYGNRFVYLLDISTSMRAKERTGLTRFETAARELLRSVSELDEDQSFLVILFCYRTFWMTDAPRLVPATAANKSRLRSWLYRVQLAPGTDPRWGLVTGLKLRPDALFLLSDGEFNGRRKNLHRLPGNPRCERLIEQHRRPGTPIHTIAFAAKEDRGRLAAIAQASGGLHRFWVAAAR